MQGLPKRTCRDLDKIQYYFVQNENRKIYVPKIAKLPKM